MKVAVIAVCILLVGCTARTAANADSTGAKSSGALGSAPLSQGLLLSNYYSHVRHDPPTYLTLSLSPLTIQPYAPVSRFDAALLGAGTGATIGMFVGALGNTFGLFDEKTTWMLTGALAASGALYSGAKYDVRATLRPESGSSIPTGDTR
jgi:hypothetical protein